VVINVDVSGSISIIEIVPAVRIFPSATETQSINFFGQAGVGLFLLKAKSEVSGTISDPFFGTVTIDEKVDESESKVGLSLGAGITVGKVGSTQIEILPLYHIVFTENESTKYFSVNVGVVFGK